MVYSTEKTLKELGDKLSADEKNRLESALNDLKEKLNGTDIDAIKDAKETLTKTRTT